MAHLHLIEEPNGDVVDYLVFCSDYCHKMHVTNRLIPYMGWNGCNEISTTQPCEYCKATVNGLDE